MKKINLFKNCSARYFLSLGIVLAGCAGLSPMDKTYQPPNKNTALVVFASQRTTTPIYIEVCDNQRWERAATIGRGLVSSGKVVMDDRLDGASRPGNTPLSDTATILIPLNQDVKIRVRSNPEFISGSPIGYGVVESCEIPMVFKSEQEFSYKATWERTPQKCGLSLIKSFRNKESGVIEYKVVTEKTSCS
ncbi:hypothetical protein [Duganella sp. HH101]|uniref:hypothetical protein n=1 Tax=Duganella sp. HH101 TaxID=1781066 RepID=UPI0008937F08|nr:hypothetical protein [Duganella sp. HH101]OFA01067.1 hypothetical protein DUGA2_43990 [Duganella sp. HH101]